MRWNGWTLGFLSVDQVLRDGSGEPDWVRRSGEAPQPRQRSANTPKNMSPNDRTPAPASTSLPPQSRILEFRNMVRSSQVWPSTRPPRRRAACRNLGPGPSAPCRGGEHRRGQNTSRQRCPARSGSDSGPCLRKADWVGNVTGVASVSCGQETDGDSAFRFIRLVASPQLPGVGQRNGVLMKMFERGLPERTKAGPWWKEWLSLRALCASVVDPPR